MQRGIASMLVRLALFCAQPFLSQAEDATPHNASLLQTWHKTDTGHTRHTPHSGNTKNDPRTGKSDCPCVGATGHSDEYGFFCKAWNQWEARCTTKAPPSHCKSEWCYINPNTCDRPYHVGKNSKNLHYSYATCGFLDTYSDSPLERVLSRSMLRISYANITGDNGWGPAAFEQFMFRVFDAHNVTFQEVPISNESRRIFPNSNCSACVHEVALNGTDICMTPMWETTQRLKLNEFTVQVDHDVFYLVVKVKTKANGSESWLHALQKTFAPFEPKVWILIIVVGLLAAFTHYIIDRNDPKGPLAGLNTVSAAAHCVYESFLSLCTGGSGTSEKVVTNPSKIMHLGLSFFILVIICTYTASLTDYLVSSADTGQIHSLDAAIKQRMKICGSMNIGNTMAFLKPEIESLWVDAVTSKDVVDGMDNGLCDVAIMAEDCLKAAQAGLYSNDDRHCNKMTVGKAVFTLGLSVPVNSAVQQAMSWAMVRQMEHGTWLFEASKAKARLVPASLCATSEGGMQKTAMKVQDVEGVAMLAVLAMIVSLAWHLLESRRLQDTDEG
mmetsp:Transcript_11405/g.22003  ORF Transcript_11405/g.22003 Transcript_11405/m.22003 type:complete len:555 (+) Transcript_11405:91-1755(+)